MLNSGQVAYDQIANIARTYATSLKELNNVYNFNVIVNEDSYNNRDGYNNCYINAHNNGYKIWWLKWDKEVRRL